MVSMNRYMVVYPLVLLITIQPTFCKRIQKRRKKAAYGSNQFTIERHLSSEREAEGKKEQHRENEGVLGVLASSWRGAAEEESLTKLHITKCKHPDTGDLVDLNHPCDKSTWKIGKKQTEYNDEEYSDYEGKKDIKEVKSNDEDDEEDAGKKSGKKESYYDIHYCTDEQLAKCESNTEPPSNDIMPTSNKTPAPSPSPTKSKIASTKAPTSSKDKEEKNEADYCSQIAQGKGQPGKFSVDLTISVLLFANTALGKAHYKKFQHFLQAGVAPDSVGCEVDWSSLFSDDKTDNRRLATNGQEDGITTVKVEEFKPYQQAEGESCSGWSSGYCSYGKTKVVATGDDDKALSKYPKTFFEAVNKNINDQILSALGLTGLAELNMVGGETNTNNNGNGNTESDKDTTTENENVGNSGSGNDGGSDNGGSGNGSDRGNDVSAVEQVPPPSKSSLKTGPILAVVFSGLAFFLIIIVALNRKQLSAYASDAMKNTCSDDRDIPEETTRHSSSDGGSYRRIARIVNDISDEDNSWQEGNRSDSPPMYATEVDDEGFPVSIEVTDQGNPIYTLPDFMHPLDEICDSPLCRQCKRQKSVRFVSSEDDPNYEHREHVEMAERNYIVDDTVDL